MARLAEHSRICKPYTSPPKLEIGIQRDIIRPIDHCKLLLGLYDDRITDHHLDSKMGKQNVPNPSLPATHPFSNQFFRVNVRTREPRDDKQAKELKRKGIVPLANC